MTADDTAGHGAPRSAPARTSTPPSPATPTSARPPTPTASPAPAAPIDSDALFRGAVEVQIAHRGSLYRLKQTALGKLILTK